MTRRRKLKLIEDESSRKATSKMRTSCLMRKLDELVKLCDVKACAVVYSPCIGVPAAWPSREGVEEVVSIFKEVPKNIQKKRMFDQADYTRKRINKAKQQLEKLCEENRKLKIQQFINGCLKGDKMEFHFDDRNEVEELKDFIDKCYDNLTRRMEILTMNGESSSSFDDVADAATALIEFSNQIHSENMNHNQKEPLKLNFQPLYDFYDQIPQTLHLMNVEFHLNWNQDRNSNLREDIDLNSYPKESLMDTIEHSSS